MSIISIARGTLSGALVLSKNLSNELGYKLVMREEVYEVAKAYGIEETGLGVIGILDQKPPSFWHRFTENKKLYLSCFQTALLDLAIAGNLIYVGHLGHLLLPNYPRILRVRLAASESYRIVKLREERGVDAKEAYCILQDMDERRLGWSKFLYGVDWRDPVLYDIVINPEKIDTGMATSIISNIMKSSTFQPNELDVNILKNLKLASLIQLNLFKSPRTRGIEVKITADADEGKVKIIGNPPPFGTSIWEQDLNSVAFEVKGVKEITIVHGLLV